MPHSRDVASHGSAAEIARRMRAGRWADSTVLAAAAALEAAACGASR